MTSKAVSRKALRESLAPCSDELKRQVTSSRVLKKKNTLNAMDLNRQAQPTGLDNDGRRAVAVAAATGRYP